MNHLNLGATKIAIFIDLTKFYHFFLKRPAPTPLKTQIFTEKVTHQDRDFLTGVSIFILWPMDLTAHGRHCPKKRKL